MNDKPGDTMPPEVRTYCATRLRLRIVPKTSTEAPGTHRPSTARSCRSSDSRQGARTPWPGVAHAHGLLGQLPQSAYKDHVDAASDNQLEALIIDPRSGLRTGVISYVPCSTKQHAQLSP